MTTTMTTTPQLDPRRREFLLPTRIVWQSEGPGAPQDSASLLTSDIGQADLARNNPHPGFLKMFRFAKGVRPYSLAETPWGPAAPDDDSANRAAVAQVLAPYTDKVVRCRRPGDVADFLALTRLSQRRP